MKITPYLIFNGKAEEAAHFYVDVLEGRIENLHRYDSVPPGTGLPEVPEDYKERVLHCCIIFSGGSISMADTVTDQRMDFGNGGHVLTLHCESIARTEEVYFKLCVDAQKIAFELAEVYFAKRYAEVVDRYGVSWALMYEENNPCNERLPGQECKNSTPPGRNKS